MNNSYIVNDCSQMNFLQFSDSTYRNIPYQVFSDQPLQKEGLLRVGKTMGKIRHRESTGECWAAWQMEKQSLI